MGATQGGNIEISFFGCYNAPNMNIERGIRRDTRERVNPMLSEWLRSNGIKAVLFDLDDTLLDTSTFIRAHEREYVSVCSQFIPHISLDELATSYREADREAYKTDSVYRSRWDTITRLLGDTYGESTRWVFENAKPILLQMYDVLPDLFPGALATLEAFRDASVKMGVVTHAEESVVYEKLNKTNIREYFSVVRVVDAKKKGKSPDDWLGAIEELGVLPEEVLVVGDNIIGDIQAAKDAGVIITVALPSPWEVYASPIEPLDVLHADRIEDVIPVLLASTPRSH